MRMGTILDDDQIMLFGNIHDGVHIGHLCPQMDGDDGFGAFGDGGGNGRRTEAVGVGVNVGDDGNAASGHRGGGGGLKGVGRHDDLIAPTQAGGT
jgi:hypothetical protein